MITITLTPLLATSVTMSLMMPRVTETLSSLTSTAGHIVRSGCDRVKLKTERLLQLQYYCGGDTRSPWSWSCNVLMFLSFHTTYQEGELPTGN